MMLLKSGCSRAILAGAVTLVLLLFVGYHTKWFMPSTPPMLRFAYDLFPGSLPVVLAEKLGFFQNGKCVIELVQDNQLMHANSRLAAGYYSGIATSIGTAVASSTILTEQRIVYIKDDSRGADLFLADHSISKFSDLVGKKAGVLIGDFGEFWLDYLLMKAGLAIDDVEIVPSTGLDVPQLIESKSILAGHSRIPHAQKGVSQGQKVLASTAHDEFVIADVIIFRKDAILRIRPCIKQFLNAWSQAVVYWRAHPVESVALLSEALGQDPATLSLDGIKIFDSRENLQLLSSFQIRRTMETYARFYRKRNITISHKISEQLLDPSLVQEVNEAKP